MLCRHWCYQSAMPISTPSNFWLAPKTAVISLLSDNISLPSLERIIAETGPWFSWKSQNSTFRLHWLKLNKPYTVKSLRLNSSIDGKPVDVCLLSLSAELYLDDWFTTFQHICNGRKLEINAERHVGGIYISLLVLKLSAVVTFAL